MSTFRDFSREDLSDKFGLHQKKECAILTQWLSSNIQLDALEEQALERLRKRANDYIETWNEEELKLRFISLLIDLVDYDNPHYKIFAERHLTAVIKGISISGKVDFLLASGEFKHRKPYFCIHEYKAEFGTSPNDPRAQLLTEMLVAQVLNEHERPIYGAYITGRNWFFVVLEGEEYCVSKDYSVTRKNELETIFKVLKGLKDLIQMDSNQNK